MSTKEKLHEAQHNSLKTDADLRYAITRQGDKLVKKKGYKSIEGMDAIVRFLCDKHHWFPHQVRQLSTDDLKLLLDGDLED